MAKHLAEPLGQSQQAPIWRTKIALSAVLMVIIIILTILGFRWLTTDHEATPDSALTVNNTEPEPFDPPVDDASVPEETQRDLLIVHVAGEVQQPGIVELEPTARVIDAIDNAGGPTDEAHMDALNLAAIVNDGEYILVPDRQTTAEAPPNSLPSGGTGLAGSNPTVNLNTADSTELETLPGVGPATAEKIIAHREQHGAFAQLSDLEAVSGIGPATLERLDGLVTW
ncbi:MAG TPA: helix-hairpin-helix domain-containing protein [Enteractinococcus helveticum]|uniref:Helix-hairpin-helix domain-containing protein n=1 Tax=Enteractinococcus helveticum TaxID=1837282 RepID=A0A921FL94_9MICC|nr:helix-hairpin-helix domain-containing protein [Enteractinococcus helveticum]HJF14104.1 helix-hairpin-helix domain-containing protein [Enteractinococcus helveticum]